MKVITMLAALLLQGMHAFGSGWTIPGIAIAIVSLAAIVALVVLALKHFGVQVPPLVANVFWIVLAAVIVIVGIKIVAGMW